MPERKEIMENNRTFIDDSLEMNEPALHELDFSVDYRYQMLKANIKNG